VLASRESIRPERKSLIVLASRFVTSPTVFSGRAIYSAASGLAVGPLALPPRWPSSLALSGLAWKKHRPPSMAQGVQGLPLRVMPLHRFLVLDGSSCVGDQSSGPAQVFSELGLVTVIPPSCASESWLSHFSAIYDCDRLQAMFSAVLGFAKLLKIRERRHSNPCLSGIMAHFAFSSSLESLSEDIGGVAQGCVL